MKTTRKHERFIEDLRDGIRVTPDFGFYLRRSYRSLGHLQSPVSEETRQGRCSVRGREFKLPFFQRLLKGPGRWRQREP